MWAAARQGVSGRGAQFVVTDGSVSCAVFYFKEIQNREEEMRNREQNSAALNIQHFVYVHWGHNGVRLPAPTLSFGVTCAFYSLTIMRQ
jgi:hypothetical protein